MTKLQIWFSNYAERNYPVDIAFLIGSSRTTTQAHWRTTLDFVKSIADRFPVSEWGARMALISFDTSPRVEFSFRELTGPQLNNYEVRRLIDRAKYKNGPTRIDRALKLANTYLFTQAGGSRRNAMKVGTCSVYFGPFQRSVLEFQFRLTFALKEHSDETALYLKTRKIQLFYYNMNF